MIEKRPSAIDDQSEKTPTAWKVSRGPVKVDRYSLEVAKAINAMLTAPISVLPKVEGDLVLPFRVGIGAEIEKLLRPTASAKELRKALRRYAYSAAYLYASAQPDACRHEINGEPIEPVSELDRVNARQSFLIVQEKRDERRRERNGQVVYDDDPDRMGNISSP